MVAVQSPFVPLPQDLLARLGLALEHPSVGLFDGCQDLPTGRGHEQVLICRVDAAFCISGLRLPGAEDGGFIGRCMPAVDLHEAVAALAAKLEGGA
jgi:hypothetical protein